MNNEAEYTFSPDFHSRNEHHAASILVEDKKLDTYLGRRQRLAELKKEYTTMLSKVEQEDAELRMEIISKIRAVVDPLKPEIERLGITLAEMHLMAPKAPPGTKPPKQPRKQYHDTATQRLLWNGMGRMPQEVKDRLEKDPDSVAITDAPPIARKGNDSPSSPINPMTA